MDMRPLWDFDDVPATEARFRAMLNDLSPDDALQVRTQIARCLGLQKRFDEAHAELDAVETALAGKPEVSRTRAYYCLERGRAFNSAGDKVRAKVLFEDAARAAAEEDDLRIDALHMLAIVATPEESVAINRDALAQARASADEAARRWEGSLLNNLGWALHDLEQFEEAFVTFEEALEARIRAGAEGPIRIARWCVARCLRSLGRHEEALAILETLPKDGYTLEELVENLRALGRDPEPYATQLATLGRA